MRTAYLITYDIADPARWRKVWRILRGFGDAVQLSVFRCDLNARERVELHAALSGVIHHKHDQVLVATLGPAETSGRQAITSLGKAYEEPVQTALVL